MKEAKNPVGAVQTSVAILEELYAREEAGVTELADALNLSKGTVHNHLATLRNAELVARDDEKFRHSLRFFEFGEHARRRRAIYEIGRPEVDELATETGELANILVEEHGRGIYLHRAQGSRALSLDTGTGVRVYLHNTALGKAILAHLPESRVTDILDRHGMPATTENTITDRAELFQRLDEINDQGYAYDREERAPGIRCVAAPVVTNDEVVRGAVSVAGPATRIRGKRLESELPELVRSTAKVISINLSYS